VGDIYKTLIYTGTRLSRLPNFSDTIVATYSNFYLFLTEFCLGSCNFFNAFRFLIRPSSRGASSSRGSGSGELSSG
jgi:hypothetical protein